MSSAHDDDPLLPALKGLLELPADSGLAYIFPGQGSQQVGMGRDVAEWSQAAGRVFEAADGILEAPLRRLCFEGPEGDLVLTSNAQPAILVTSLAILAAAAENGALTARPSFVAGHSLGQYTALVVSGALSFRDALLTVRERGRLMAEAGEAQKGTMAAVVGLDEETVQRICEESGAETCNYNLVSQTVIGGAPEKVERACALAKERGGKGLPVNVSGAFHTSLMQPAAEALRGVLSRVSVESPAIPVVSNVTGEPVAAGDILEDLAIQVIRPVRWRQSVGYMTGAGVKTFVEIGSGKVLTAMMKRHSKDIPTITLNGAEALATPSNV